MREWGEEDAEDAGEETEAMDEPSTAAAVEREGSGDGSVEGDSKEEVEEEEEGAVAVEGVEDRNEAAAAVVAGVAALGDEDADAEEAGA